MGGGLDGGLDKYVLRLSNWIDLGAALMLAASLGEVEYKNCLLPLF